MQRGPATPPFADSPEEYTVRSMPLPGSMELPLDGADLWFAALDGPLDPLSSDTSVLAPCELRRAQGMSAGPRRTFVGARARLRRLLAAYLPTSSGPVDLRRGVNGKPRLTGHLAHCGLHFNTSHCQARAMFAFSRSQVGVDIEALRPLSSALRLAERFFTPSEIAEVAKQRARGQPDTFLKIWTCKEAYVKAIGGSVPQDLGTFQVALEPRRGAALLDEDGRAIGGWTMLPLQPQRGIIGALAVCQAKVKLRRWLLAGRPSQPWPQLDSGARNASRKPVS
ncbi:MAG: 4'-phosphopantetheinyl transferase superfamily protein [Bryobacterales bacterium]|nr:4'-phosphopantetheinyl transferase superfamily protein [Bryobacterales bacterium]